jgi:peptidoglycan/xylan/chitin deacetylase (PgdA/CDA1 family)
MQSRWWLVVVAVLGMGLLTSCAGKREPAQPVGPVVPAALGPAGSAAARAECWTAAELAGTPADKAMGPVTAPDLNPPERTAPLTTLHPLPPERRGNIRRVEPAAGEKVVALTFDLCELATRKAGYDFEIVNYLRSMGVKATFFAGGKWMRTHPEQSMQLMADPLFEVGNHTWTHGNLGVMTGERMRDQILWTQAEYELLRERLMAKPCMAGLDERARADIPPVPTTLRLPYGRCSPETLETLARLGLSAVQWDVDSRDAAKDATAESIARRVIYAAGKRSGSIVLFHGNGQGRYTAKALSIIVPRLLKMGYTFLTVDELLTRAPITVATECYYNRPGDNLIFDKRFGDGTQHPSASE